MVLQRKRQEVAKSLLILFSYHESEGGLDVKQIMKMLNFPQRTAYYYINKLKKLNQVKRIDYGLYDITDDGKKILQGFLAGGYC